MELKLLKVQHNSEMNNGHHGVLDWVGQFKDYIQEVLMEHIFMVLKEVIQER